MRITLRNTILALLALLIAAPVFAQMKPAPPAKPRKPPREPRGFLAVDGLAQAAASTPSDTFNFELHAEDGTITADYPGKTSGAVNVSGGHLVWRRFGVGAGFSRASSSGSVNVSASVPHPLLPDRLRQVSGTTSGFIRSETALHVQLYWEPRRRGRLKYRVFGGPSFFNVEQDVVDGVDVDEEYPFETVAFGRARTGRASASGPGGHAGMDLSWMFSRQVGAGVLLRYARARLDLNGPASRSVSSDGGGFQAGGGLRVVF